MPDSTAMRLYDATPCKLGEGAFWHPERNQFFWFDILARRLMSRLDDHLQIWNFDTCVSAAGWIDHDTLLIASETGLIQLTLSTDARKLILPLEADQPDTRSNDGRADPMGGFWISTMGKSAETGRGALYRYYGGALRKIRSAMSIPNTICFAADGRRAYFSDTASQQIFTWDLDCDGWPIAEPDLFADLRTENLSPDGAVCDSEGNLWVALWGAAKVAMFSPDGQSRHTVPVPAQNPTCPAFGGPNLSTLFITSAQQSTTNPTQSQGQTFQIETSARGLPEPRVRA